MPLESNSKEWYRLWFNHFYPKLYPHRNLEEAKSQVEALIKLLGPGENCLDIACGTGRHLRYLSEYFTRSVGLDLSEELIEIGKLEGNFDKSEVYIADMRTPPLNEKFSLITNFFTGLGYFKTDTEHSQMLKCWAGLLESSGTLLIDYLNRDYVLANFTSDSIKEIDGYTVEERRSITPDSLRIEKSIVISKDEFKKSYFESVRMYNYKELLEMLKKCGLSTIDVYGDFAWNNFDSASERLILVAKNV